MELSKKELLKAMLVKKIDQDKEEIAEFLLTNNNDNIEHLYNLWLKKLKRPKINLTQEVKELIKEYEKAPNFYGLNVEINYHFNTENYERKPIKELSIDFKLTLYLLNGKENEYGRPEYDIIRTDGYHDDLDTAKKKLKAEYEKYLNPEKNKDIEITI